MGFHFLINKYFVNSSKRILSLIDSLKATSLLNSTNSPIPDLIRIITIDYFIRIGIDPKDYYVLKDRPMQSNNEEGFITFKRIGALREIYHMINYEK